MDVITIEYGTLHCIYNAFGMIISTVVVLVFIYIKKYYEIFFKEYKKYASVSMNNSVKYVLKPTNSTNLNCDSNTRRNFDSNLASSNGRIDSNID